MSVISRSPRVLKEIFEEARKAWLSKDSNKTVFYRESGDYDGWRRCFSRFPRPLSTVVLDESTKNDFVEDVRDYLSPATARWYSSRGIPYRRGYLFYGPPGTGKSSLSFAVAGVFKLPVYVMSLSSPKLNEDRLTTLFAELPTKCILLLEDIDAAFVTREGQAAAAAAAASEQEDAKRAGPGARANGTNDKPGISFSALLNAIDGECSFPV